MTKKIHKRILSFVVIITVFDWFDFFLCQRQTMIPECHLPFHARTKCAKTCAFLFKQRALIFTEEQVCDPQRLDPLPPLPRKHLSQQQLCLTAYKQNQISKWGGGGG